MFVKIGEERVRKETIKAYGSGKSDVLLIDNPYYIWVQLDNESSSRFLYFDSEKKCDKALEELDSLLIG